MKETDWAKEIAKRLDGALPHRFCVESGKRLIYANKIVQSEETETLYFKMSYQTDILVNEKGKKRVWKPRVDEE